MSFLLDFLFQELQLIVLLLDLLYLFLSFLFFVFQLLYQDFMPSFGLFYLLSVLALKVLEGLFIFLFHFGLFGIVL